LTIFKPAGRFLCIIEGRGGYNTSIIIPSTGLAEFQKLLDEMIKASNELPEKNQTETQSLTFLAVDDGNRRE
jgi:hypothetical protein